MIQENYDLERARTAASKLNDEALGILINIGDNRRVAICCSTFTDNTLGLTKSFPQMINYIT